MRKLLEIFCTLSFSLTPLSASVIPPRTPGSTPIEIAQKLKR
jgi:hypothetical protein